MLYYYDRIQRQDNSDKNNRTKQSDKKKLRSTVDVQIRHPSPNKTCQSRLMGGLPREGVFVLALLAGPL